MRSVLFIYILLMLTACSGSGKSIPVNDAGSGSILTGKSEPGISLSDLGDMINPKSGGLPINALLWRASLDIASSIPIDDIDTFGGSIITEWYSLTTSPDERIKLTFFVLDLELRSDAIRIQVYVQRRQDGLWIDNGTDSDLARKLEELVLTRAREIRASSVTETVD
tara:strand:- start:255 stop:755 length:501 start_codon:yes stop_codon:yes gene_type:complete